MATNFKYATTSDLIRYFNRSTDYDNKRAITTGWTSLGNSIYIAYNTGPISKLFLDGRELDEAMVGASSGETWDLTMSTTLDSQSDMDTTTFNTFTYDADTNEANVKPGDYAKLYSADIGTEYVFIESINIITP